MIVKTVKSIRRIEAIDITNIISEEAENIGNGIMLIYVPHTTAAITINEAYDPSVMDDLMEKLSELAPYSKSYKHSEGNSDAHIKSSLIGSSVQLIVESGNLILGRWQGIFFLEFDGPRDRKIFVKTMG